MTDYLTVYLRTTVKSEKDAFKIDCSFVNSQRSMFDFLLPTVDSHNFLRNSNTQSLLPLRWYVKFDLLMCY